MQERLTKKNSIFFNQLWINKIIEEGRMDLLPSNRPDDGLSIGEYLEQEYNESEDFKQTQKINKKNSLLYEREWILKFKEENLRLPKNHLSSMYSYGEILEIKYKEIEMLREYKESLKNKSLELK